MRECTTKGEERRYRALLIGLIECHGFFPDWGYTKNKKSGVVNRIVNRKNILTGKLSPVVGFPKSVVVDAPFYEVIAYRFSVDERDVFPVAVIAYEVALVG